MKRFIEIRSYTVKPGMRDEFDRLVQAEAVPMLKRWKVDVVACRPSPHDEDSYYLIRAYDSLQHRQESQDAFYGSAEWLEGPREPILALIDTYTSVVIEADEATINGLRG